MKKICVLVRAVVVAIARAQGPGRRFITENDLLKFTWLQGENNPGYVTP
jgi:hypothetical protein